MKTEIETNLKVLLCSRKKEDTETLHNILSERYKDLDKYCSCSLQEARGLIDSENVNTIIINPLSYNLDEVYELSENCRGYTEPIVFAFYVDYNELIANEKKFYNKRNHLRHYYLLYKNVDNINDLGHDLYHILEFCNAYVKNKIRKPKEGNCDKEKDLNEYPQFSVFVSYQFREEEKFKSVKRKLRQEGFIVRHGCYRVYDPAKFVLDEIMKSDYLLSLMTKKYELKSNCFMTSTWLYEERGIAFFNSAKSVFLSEIGVKCRIGMCKYDSPYVFFGENGFKDALEDAIDRLVRFRRRDKRKIFKDDNNTLGLMH